MIRALALSLCILVIAPAAARADEEPALDAMREYLAFTEYEAGIILPNQLTEDIFAAVHFIDTRDAAQFEAATIPGAVHIEWREVLDRIDEIPVNGKVILFCNTGTLSAQAAFALRVAGRDNVVVMQTGYRGWLLNAAYQPATTH